MSAVLDNVLPAIAYMVIYGDIHILSYFMDCAGKNGEIPEVPDRQGLLKGKAL